MTFHIIPAFLKPHEIAYLSSVLLGNLSTKNNVRYGDKTVKNAYYTSTVHELDFVLYSKLDAIRSLYQNDSIVPHYAYCRYYGKDTELKRHIDNNCLEYTVTINIYQTHPYEMLLTDPETVTTTTVNQAPGDALVFQGTQMPHARPKYNGTMYIQLFLHYMNSNNPHISKAHKLTSYTAEDVERIVASHNTSRVFIPVFHMWGLLKALWR